MKLWSRGILSVLALLFVLLTAGGNAIFAQTQTESASSQVSDAGNKNPTGSGRLGTVEIDYKDNVDGTGPIEGAEFTFYRLNGELQTEAGKVHTDKEGIAEIRLQEGTYEVRETEPAPGHEAASGFRLTVPMKDEKGRSVYAITAEPKPVRITDTPEPTPPSESVSNPSSIPDSVPESMHSLKPEPSREPASSEKASPATTPVSEQPTMKEPKKNVTVTPTKEEKKSIQKKENVSKKPVRPAATSDSGKAVFYVVIVGSAAAVAGTMLWIRKKGERH